MRITTISSNLSVIRLKLLLRKGEWRVEGVEEANQNELKYSMHTHTSVESFSFGFH